MASRKRWTNLELLTLGDLYRDGLSYNEIACKLGRTKGQVSWAITTYRDVINIEYRSKGAGRKPVKYFPREELVAKTERSAWWKFW